MIMILIIWLIIVISVLIFASISIWFLKIELYFLRFRIENHPVLKAMVDDVLQKICETEGIQVFNKTQNEMDASGKGDAAGLYIYTRNSDWFEIAKQRLAKIVKLEEEYKMPYKQICAIIGQTTDITKEDFTLPRILLCEETLLKFGGLNSYYTTFFHELGHHWIEKLGFDQSEENANMMGQKLIQEHLPILFQLIPSFRFKNCIENTPELTIKQKIVAYWEYLQYYYTYKDTIIKKNCNKS